MFLIFFAKTVVQEVSREIFQEPIRRLDDEILLCVSLLLIVHSLNSKLIINYNFESQSTGRKERIWKEFRTVQSG